MSAPQNTGTTKRSRRKAKALTAHVQPKPEPKAQSQGARLNKAASKKTKVFEYMEAAGVDVAREVTKLEALFMAPHLIEPLPLFPDSTNPRGVSLMTLEVPLTLSASGTASGTINRSLAAILSVDGVGPATTFSLQTWDNQYWQGNSVNWFEASSSKMLSTKQLVDRSRKRVAQLSTTGKAGPGPTLGVGGLQPFGAYALASGSTDVSAWLGSIVGSDGQHIDVQEYIIAGEVYPAVPVLTGDILTVTAVTQDTTANRFRLDTTWITESAGVYSFTPASSALAAGLGEYVQFAGQVAPANTVALYKYNIVNTLASTAASVGASVYATINGVAANVVYPVGGADQYADLLAVTDKARVTALAFHLRNDSPALTAQGEVVCYQQRDEDEALPSRSVTTLAAFAKAYRGRLAEGAYGWVNPWASSSAQTAMTIPWEDADITNNFTELDEVDRVHWAVKVDPAATEQALVMVVYAVVEYKTTHSFIPVRMGKIDHLALQDSANFMRLVPNIMANDSHWDKIGSAIKTGAAIAASRIVEVGFEKLGDFAVGALMAL